MYEKVSGLGDSAHNQNQRRSDDDDFDDILIITSNIIHNFKGDETDGESTFSSDGDIEAQEARVTNTINQEYNFEDSGASLDLDSPTEQKIKNLLRSAWPVITSFFLSIIGNFILMIFAGHAKESNNLSVATVFAGVSLSNLFCNVTFRSLIIGMTGGMETLGSQNNGAGRYKEVGRVLHRSMFILACTSLLSIGLWWNAEAFFRWAGLEPDVCHVVGHYVRIRMLEMPISCFNESYEKYLMSIGVMHSPMYANIALIIATSLFCSIGIFVMHWDYRCLAGSWVLSVAVAGIVMVLSSYKHPSVIRTQVKWDWDSVLQWDKLREFIELGVPGTLMLCSEWWAYEILTLFAGRLGTLEVSAETIIMQLAALAFMVPLGLSVATASIVGNALGMKKREYAIQMSHYAIMTILVIEIGISVVMRLVGKIFCNTFTTDEGVLETTYELIIFLSIFCGVDGIQGVASGILRGAGQQAVGAITNVFSFYVIGLPFAWFLCFNAKMRVPGLMVGISAGTSFQVACLSFLIYRRPDYIFKSQLKEDDCEDKEHDKSIMDTSSAPLSPRRVYRQVNGSITDVEMVSMGTDSEDEDEDADLDEVSFSSAQVSTDDIDAALTAVL